jgi:serine protease
VVRPHENIDSVFRHGLYGHSLLFYTIQIASPLINLVSSSRLGREQEIVEKLRAKGKEAEENFEMHASSGTFPNDLYFSPYQWHFDKVQAKQAWELTDHKAGNGVIVAVLDTGLHIGGVDGIGCVKTNLQRNTNRDNYNVDDVDGHGTHVAGTIAQTTNNGEGVAGLAFGACIMPVKVLGDDGSGSFGDIAEGIYWAVDNGANVINMSLGVDASSGMRSDSVVDRALQYAYSKGVTVVAASGNDSYGKNVAYPSIYPTVLSVGATGFSNKRAYYSNYGEGLDIVAPGGDTSGTCRGGVSFSLCIGCSSHILTLFARTI